VQGYEGLRSTGEGGCSGGNERCGSRDGGGEGRTCEGGRSRSESQPPMDTMGPLRPFLAMPDAPPRPSCANFFANTAAPMWGRISESGRERRSGRRARTGGPKRQTCIFGSVSILVARAGTHFDSTICSNSQSRTSTTEVIAHTADEPNLALVTRHSPSTSGIARWIRHLLERRVDLPNHIDEVGRWDELLGRPLIVCEMREELFLSMEISTDLQKAYTR
jgi:hypothetical protein